MGFLDRFDVRDLSQETSLRDLYDEYLSPPDLSEEDQQAYEEYARERTIPIVLSLLWFLLGLTVLSLITDPWIFRNRPRVIRGMVLIWTSSLLLSVVCLADYYFGRMFLKEYPDLTAIAIGVMIGLGISSSGGIIGRLNFPLFYSVYLIPFITAFLMSLNLRKRIYSTFFVMMSCTVGYITNFTNKVFSLHSFSHSGVLLVSAVLSVGGGHIIHTLFRRSFFQEREAERERERAEALLKNILPEPVIDELKSSQEVIAQEYDQASVLFADIVGFTPLAEDLPPEAVVRLLNDIFSEFDLLVRDYELEKIKTIGDEYMVASGLPERRSNHAARLAELSVEMNKLANQYESEWIEELDMRMGIHSGPVMAGVIGIDKFIYDIWGDTVNVASRLESQGVPGEIQVSPETRQNIIGQSDNDYSFKERGVIDVKGKGEMKTYFMQDNED